MSFLLVSFPLHFAAFAAAFLLCTMPLADPLYLDHTEREWAMRIMELVRNASAKTVGLEDATGRMENGNIRE